MMDPSNINNFEDQWRKAFQEASETPPPSLWESIEARLDKDEEKVVPLWWRSPKTWYAAASIAALLLVGGGLWFSGSKNDHVEVAVTSQPAQRPEVENQKPIEPQVQENQDAEQLAATTNAKPEQRAVVAKTTGSRVRNRNVESAALAAIRVQKEVSAQPEATITDRQSKGTLTPEIETPKVAFDVNTAVNENAPISAQLLASLPYNDLDVYVQKRHVFFRPEIQIEEPVKASKPKEYYAGIGIMPASFNPDVQLKEAPTAFLGQAVGQKRSTSGSSEARASYAVQTQGGIRLSKHWSMETGVSYLRGNSAYEGGGYVLSAYNSVAANALENALAGLSSPSNSPSFADKSGNFNNGALYIDVAKKVSNNYQYLQLPVQAGFTLNPDKKFSYSVLGGMMANFFLVNELESASGEIIRTTASDEIYRGMNWAATTGLRLNYKLSSNWAANLTGSYQKAVSSGFRSNQSLDAHPYLYGVSWSVRYSF